VISQTPCDPTLNLPTDETLNYQDPLVLRTEGLAQKKKLKPISLDEHAFMEEAYAKTICI